MLKGTKRGTTKSSETKMTVTSSNFIHDVISYIKTTITNNITDPITSSRKAGSSFVMSSYPQRAVQYPLITIKLVNQKASRAGMQTTAMDVTITLEIRVWARDQKEKDDLSNKVYYQLKELQFTASTGTIANNLHHYKLNSDVEVDEPGEGNPKSRILQVEYKFYNV